MNDTGSGTGKKLLAGKTNYAPAKGLGFDIIPSRDDSELGVVAWATGELDETADDAFRAETGADPRQPTKITQAIAWIRESIVSSGGRVPRKELLTKGLVAGFGEKMMDRAREAAGIAVEKAGGASFWVSPTARDLRTDRQTLGACLSVRPPQEGQHPGVGHLASADHCDPVHTNEGEV